MKLLNMLSLDRCDPPTTLGAKVLPKPPLGPSPFAETTNPEVVSWYGKLKTRRKDPITRAAQKAQRHAECYGGRDVGGKGGSTQGTPNWRWGFGTASRGFDEAFNSDLAKLEERVFAYQIGKRADLAIFNDLSEADDNRARKVLTKLYAEWEAPGKHVDVWENLYLCEPQSPGPNLHGTRTGRLGSSIGVRVAAVGESVPLELIQDGLVGLPPGAVWGMRDPTNGHCTALLPYRRALGEKP